MIESGKSFTYSYELDKNQNCSLNNGLEWQYWTGSDCSVHPSVYTTPGVTLGVCTKGTPRDMMYTLVYRPGGTLGIIVDFATSSQTK